MKTVPQPIVSPPISIGQYPFEGTASYWLRLAPVLLTGMLLAPLPGVTLPPPEDLPEEVLRTEIITEARSPVDGQPLTPAEYAELQEQLQVNPQLEVLVPTKIKEDLFLLNIRKLLRTIVPFL